MSLWLMAAALERQTRSQEIRAVCARDPMGRRYIQAHALIMGEGLLFLTAFS